MHHKINKNNITWLLDILSGRALAYTLSLVLALGGVNFLATAQGNEEAEDDAVEDASALQPSSAHSEITQVITDSLANYHLKSRELNDELSKLVHTRFLDSLDPERLYLLESDIAAFNAHRYQLDDYLQQVNLIPIYDFFAVYRQRFTERMQHAIYLAEQGFDFDVNEYFEFDREQVAWAKNSDELNELWRKVLKNNFLSEKLNGTNDNDAREALVKRYQSRLRNYQQLKSDEVYQWFINSYISTLDPHSSYLSPRTSEDFNIAMSLSLEGIGAVLDLDNEYTRIRRLIPGGPAALTGQVRAGDRITAVAQGDEEMVDIVGWRIDDVVRLIRGQKGSEVRLQLLPEGAPSGGVTKVVRIIRDKIKLEHQAASKKIIETSPLTNASDSKNAVPGQRIGVIALPGFYSDFHAQRNGDEEYTSSSRDVEKLLIEMKQERVDSVIIDLRGNSGGHLSEAVALAGLFLAGEPVVQVKFSGDYVQTEYDDDAEVVWDGPLAVLIDRNSASASEIFASAMQDHQRALIIGEPTFGKGTVQNLHSIDSLHRKQGVDLGQLKITFAQFYRVNGQSTQYQGVVPDIIWPTADNNPSYGERSLDFALPQDQVEALDDSIRRSVNFHASVRAATRAHIQRLQVSPGLLYVQSRAALGKKMRARKRLSLHEAKRRAQMKEDEQLAERVLQNYKLATQDDETRTSRATIDDEEENTSQEDVVDVLGDVDAEDDDNIGDILLDEAALLLVQFATAYQKNLAEASAAN